MDDLNFDAAFVFSTPPFDNLKWQEGLEAAFAFAAFGGAGNGTSESVRTVL